MNFADITTDAEYLLDVGIGPRTHPQYWYNTGICHGNTKYPRGRDNTYIDSGNRAWAPNFKTLGIGVTDPTRKWELIGNVLQVIGPELDRRGWTFDYEYRNTLHFCFMLDKSGAHMCVETDHLPHLALLAAYHTAVKAGENNNS